MLLFYHNYKLIERLKGLTHCQINLTNIIIFNIIILVFIIINKKGGGN